MSCDKENGGLKQFERNKYFYGKLMTVMDFEAEQDYFNEKRHLINRLIHGNGIVCGLEVKDPKIKDGKMSIMVSPGVALDCCGNEIVVGTECAGKEWEVEGTVKDINYLYIRYNQCGKELDSIVGDISTCEEACCHNRIKETFKLELGEAPEIAESKTGSTQIPLIMPLERIKLVPKILKNFKDLMIPFKEKEPELEEKIKILRYLPRNYYEEYLKSCPTCEDPKVLLAVINGNGEINRGETNKYLEIVYNNPMLYDILNGHLTDFDNPHRVTAKDTGALVSINGVHGDSNSDIKLNEGSNIEISEDSTNKTINISTTAAVDSALLQLNTMSTYIRERALKSAVTSFRELGKKLAPEQAGIEATNISNLAKTAVDNKSFKSESEFLSVINRKCHTIPIEESIPDLNNGEIPDILRNKFRDNGLVLSDKASVSKVDDGYIINDRNDFAVIKEDKDINIYQPIKATPLILKTVAKDTEERLNELDSPGKILGQLKKAGISENAFISKVAADKWVVSQGEDFIIQPGSLRPICVNGLYHRGIILVNELKLLKDSAMFTKSIVGIPDFEKSLQELKDAIYSGKALEAATAMDEVCFYALMIEVTDLKQDDAKPVITPREPKINESTIEKVGIGRIRDVLKDTESDSKLKKVADIINLTERKPRSTVKEIADTLKMDEAEVKDISEDLIKRNVLKVTDTKTNSMDIKIDEVPDNIDNSVVEKIDIDSLRNALGKEDSESKKADMVNVINAVYGDTGKINEIANVTEIDNEAAKTIADKLVNAGVIKFAGGRYRPL